MHPVHHTSTTAQPTTPDSRELTRAMGAAFAAIALMGVILGAIVFLTSRPVTTVDAAATTTGEVRDGWSSYLGAAARPAAQPVQDGWSSYLLVPEIDPSTAQDGWNSYLLVPEIDPSTVVDGWNSYLLVPEIDPSTVVDGWMIRYGQDD